MLRGILFPTSADLKIFLVSPFFFFFFFFFFFEGMVK